MLVNDASDRLFSADSDVMYTTLDVLLLPITDAHGRVPSRLAMLLGVPSVLALLDLFHRQPRVRDLVSHGNVPEQVRRCVRPSSACFESVP